MNPTNQIQNSSSQNVVGESVPFTSINSNKIRDDDNESHETNLGADSSNRNGEKNKGSDNSADHVYDPQSALINNSTLDDIPEGINVYRNKKTLTQGLMDIALFSANANQLRYILDHGARNPSNAAFFYIAASLIVTSLILQIGVGLLLLVSTRYTLTKACQRELAYKYGNYVVAGIFLITVVNIFIAAFGGPAVEYLPASSTNFPVSAAIINNSTSGR